jgi:hypothetical protein
VGMMREARDHLNLLPTSPQIIAKLVHHDPGGSVLGRVDLGEDEDSHGVTTISKNQKPKTKHGRFAPA